MMGPEIAIVLLVFLVPTCIGWARDWWKGE